MAGLVTELQTAALDEKSSVCSLLRKALVVATKLRVSDFESWARCELEGYQDDSVPIPEYRKLHGSPKVWNPYQGCYQDLQCQTPELAETISTVPLGASADALEDGRGKGDGGTWMFTYPPGREHILMNAMRGVKMKPSLHIPESAIRSVLGRVRTIVLQWSLTLERQGVLGEGMTFTQEERAQAAAIHIDTLIHGVSGSQIQVNSPGARQQQDMPPEHLAELRKLVEVVSAVLHGATDSEQVRELRAEVATLKAQADSPKPKRSIIRESLSSLRTVLEGAAGEVLAAQLPTLAAALPQATSLIHELLRSIS